MKTTVVMSLVVVVMSVVAHAHPYRELAPRFDRVGSSATVRVIARPTLANLDFAAWSNNPVRYDPKRYAPDVKGPIDLADLTFSGFLTQAVNTLDETPLTQEERAAPLAWGAVENRLWELTKDNGWAMIGGRIAGEKYGDTRVFRPFQEIAALYLHDTDNETQFWVKVDFMPWAGFLGDVIDSDGDGFKEVYGRLVLDTIPDELVAAAVEWLRGDYSTHEQDRTAIVDWVTVLASYWYPTFNTDIIDMDDETAWPNAQTERRIARRLRGLRVEDPVAVVRGNPFGQPIYNVYVVEGLEARTRIAATASSAGPAKRDTAMSATMKETTERFRLEAHAHGGYEAWAARNQVWLDAIAGFLQQLPAEQMGFAGKDDWVFFRQSLEYMVGGDLGSQADEKNPLPHLVELQKYLHENNVNLLFVPVPTKADVYHEHLPVALDAPPGEIINPWGRAFLAQLQEAGIEVIDLLPHFLAAKGEEGGELYQRQDTHWTNRGLQIAAGLIAERIKDYAWYGERAEQKRAYTLFDTTFSRQGDIVARLPEHERSAYPPVMLDAQQVQTADGERYTGDRSDPVLLIGDSFTGVFELVDCRSAGVGSHIAAQTGLGVDIITSWGGGPLVRQRMMRARAKDMPHKRVVVYMMVARDLYDYSQSWAPLER